MSDPTVQYGRRFSCIIGNASRALDVSALRCEFTVRRGDTQTPNSLDMRIVNLSTATANLIQNEFTDIVVQAGYPGNIGLIFRGTIKQVRQGRDNQKDSYVDVTAADGDEAYLFANMSTSLSAGSTSKDALKKFIESMGPFGITQGYAPELPSAGRLRGRVFYGQTRDELRDFANDNSSKWSIQDGGLTLIPLTAYIPGGPQIVISPSTGLIGVPEQTQGGISVRVLLNPSIKIGYCIKLDTTAINLYRYGLDLPSQASNLFLANSIKTNASGLYYVMVCEHQGDTRGQAWYTNLTCLSVDATIPASALPKAVVDPAIAPIPRYSGGDTVPPIPGIDSPSNP